MNSENTAAKNDSLFGDVIYSYTREQAINDGVLVDATIGDFAEVTAQHHPRHHVAMTIAVFELIEKGVMNEKYCNDFKGVWHDILWMARCYGFRAIEGERLFRVIITGTGRKRYHVLKAVAHAGDKGEPCITIMLPNED